MGKLVLPIVLGVIGAVIVIGAGIIGWVVMPNIIDSRIEDQVQLKNETDTWDKWEANPVPVYLDFYIFHVENPDYNASSEIPKLIERGPFVYEEFRLKVNIKINEETDTISYTEVITYEFRRNMSIGSDSDHMYNVVNTPFIIISQAIYLISKDLAGIIIPILTALGENFVRRNVSVRDMIFDGVQLHSVYDLILSLRPGTPPAEFAGNRFAFYRGKNGTMEDKYEVRSGITNSEDFGRIVKYNDRANLNYWQIPVFHPDKNSPTEATRNSFCNMINGTDGSIFPPFVKKEDRLPIFVSDICRSIYLLYKKDIEHRDIPGYRFEFPDEFFENPNTNGDNFCFCSSPPEGLINECSGGVIRIFPCKSDAPIVTSSPHFLHADEKFRTNVGGLDPKDELHATFIELEPNTGLMLRIDKKVQISMEMQSLGNISIFKNIPHFLFPAFWANEHTQLDEKLADELISMLITPVKIIDIAKWSVLGIGIILVAASAVVFIVRR